MYAQFALVIAATAMLSAINAVTPETDASGAMGCVRPVPPEQRNAFCRGFNAVYARVESGYVWLIGRMASRSAGVMVIVALSIMAVGALRAVTRIATGFLAARRSRLSAGERATPRRRVARAHPEGAR